MYGTSRRLTMKPVLSFAETTDLPSLSPKARPASNASSSVVTVRMTSSSGMTCAGLKKCSPMKRLGRRVTTAWSITASDEVFVARTAFSSLTIRSSSFHSSIFSGRLSVIASITSWQSAKSSSSSVGWSRPRISSDADCSSFPFSTERASCFSIFPTAASSRAWSTSRRTTSYPAVAATCAIPWPIRPPPATPTFSISIRLDVMGLVEIEDRGAVRHIVLNRPEKRNAFNGELIEATGRAFEAAAADDSVRVVVLRGNGPMFSSGMDLGSLRDLSSSPTSLREVSTPILEWWNLLEEMPKPTIAQIHGACIGGAMELALAADMRVMAEDAVAAILEVRIGLIPDVGGCSRLPAVVGVGRAKELIMTGRFLGAEEALQIGFANRIAPADELDATTQKLCDELLAAAPIAVALAKRVLEAAAKPALRETLEREVEAQGRLAASDDFAEGTTAFLEKRAPSFAGR